jgi:site-specific recombinase XerD
MSHQDPVTAVLPQPSQEEMRRDHKQIVQNHLDTFIMRGLSRNTIDQATWFIERWFENTRVRDESGERQMYIWEAMNLGEGRKRIKEFLMTLSAVDDDNKVCLRATTVRAYASQLERLFINTLRSPYIDGLQTISSKYGPIDNPFTGVEYPIHSRDHLRSECFYLTPDQILELLVFVREVYPSLTYRNSTAGRLYTIIMLITETGMRCVETINLDALGADRDIFYKKELIQTRFGKGHNSSGPQTRVIPLTDRAEITLKQYEQEVRPQFRNHLVNPALFLTMRGERLSYPPLQSSFQRLIEQARKHGVDLPPNLTLHDLRASFATNFLEANPDQFWKLMEILGHVSVSATCLYIRFRNKHRVLSMKQARGPRPGRTGFGAMVYNT